MRFNLKRALLDYQDQTGAKPTYEELASIAGCGKTTIYHIANNKRRRIDLDVLERLCNFLDCTPNDLIKVEGRE